MSMLEHHKGDWSIQFGKYDEPVVFVMKTETNKSLEYKAVVMPVDTDLRNIKI
jgi:hypothetical protein